MWLQGTKLLAALGVAGTAYSAHGISGPHEIASHNEGKILDHDVALRAGRQCEDTSYFVSKYTFRRRGSIAASIASTKSVVSITSYMRQRGIFSLFRNAGAGFDDTDTVVWNTPRYSTSHVEDDGSNPIAAATSEAKLHESQETKTSEEAERLKKSIDICEDNETAPNSASYYTGQQETELAFDLHHYSTELVTSLAPYIATCPQLQNSSHAMQEDMGRLYLWGEAFGDGRLNIILQASEELKNTVLEINATISTILLQGELKRNTCIRKTLIEIE